MMMQPFQPVSYNFGNERGLYNAPMGQGMGVGGSYMKPPQVSSGNPMTPTGNVVQTNAPVYEQSYVENILRLNLGKVGTFYMTYENNKEWNAKIFQGVVEAAGRDHIIISEKTTGRRVILLTLYLD